MEDQVLLPNTLKAGDVGMLLTIGHGLTPLDALPNRTPCRICMKRIVGVKLGIIRVLVVLYVRCP